ncbi:hypothetical protein KKC06_06800 [Patescibacteria group bacterium]|nr:hypothetical protein [Patescibacteria group bacterium]
MNKNGKKPIIFMVDTALLREFDKAAEQKRMTREQYLAKVMVMAVYQESTTLMAGLSGQGTV